MAKRYIVLQKKLKELESELNDVFALPAETPYHQLLSEAINRRFGFLRSLLSAEIESHPHKPQHLHHIDQRLTELETVFHDWDNFRASSTNHIDTASTCSCTESCLNDDGGESPDMGSLVYEDPDTFYEGVAVEEKPAAVVSDKVEGEMKEERKVWIGKTVGIITGVLIVFCGVVARLSGCYSYKDGMEILLIPT